MTTAAEYQTRKLFTELAIGDRVECVHEVKVGMQRWTTTTSGQVVRTERRRNGLHFRRSRDDKAFSDMLLLRKDDGELTTVSIDEFTVLRRL